MSIKDTGYLDFFGERCVYVQDGMDYILVPVNEGANISRNMFQKDYKLEFTTPLTKRSIVSVKEVHSTLTDSIRLNLSYIAECYSDADIDTIIMTGNEIDEFFSPLEHYFRLKNSGQYIPSDLLYNHETVANFKFTYKQKEINIELFYGNVLMEGICTDLTIHPQLKVSFEKTKDTDYIKELHDIILKFLQFVHRKQKFNMNLIELWTHSNSKKSHVGYMFCSLYNRELRPSSRIDASFVYYNDKIGSLLDIIATDYDHFPIKHLSKNYNDPFSFSTERFAALCSAFEYEYSRNKEYPQKSELDLTEIKNTVVDCIEEIAETDDNVVSFKKEAIKRIREIGGRPGFKQRIISAYNYNEASLNSSMDQLLFRIKDVESCAGLLSSLRGKVLHNNIGYQFNDKEMECIRFLEIIQFIMTLRRASFTQGEIEIIIGVLYHCNSKYLELLRKDNNKN